MKGVMKNKQTTFGHFSATGGEFIITDPPAAAARTD
jgi:hypothetical protein